MAVMVAKIQKKLIATIQVKLCYLIQESGTKFAGIFIIKVFAINLPSQLFLGCPVGFHNFFYTVNF